MSLNPPYCALIYRSYVASVMAQYDGQRDLLSASGIVVDAPACTPQLSPAYNGVSAG